MPSEKPKRKPLFDSPSAKRARENPEAHRAGVNRGKDARANRSIGSAPRTGTRGTEANAQRSQFHAAVINRGSELKQEARTSENPIERSLANKRLIHPVGPRIRGQKFYNQIAVDEKVKKAGTI